MKLIKLFSPKGKKLYFSIRMLTGMYPRDISLYELALTHKSVMKRDDNGILQSNERLEYLGDAMLGAIVAHELYVRYPFGSEGFLTKVRSRIVSRSLLNEIAYSMGLAEILKTRLQTDPSQTHVLGDALEALIGAIYVDRGFDACRKFIIKRMLDKYVDIEKLVKKDTNYKSLLIEWAQKHKKSIRFITEEHHSTGGISPVFISNAFIDDETIGEGRGYSKKEAQQNAARTALVQVKSSNNH